ncbi:NAD(P)-dependent dehydrogenase, short-chain alcohol dehydrogenase family [Sediminibacillus albus]|uniref:NAD(P)-dependent dehydrogenase, short-chain alcohol dehydrogenase family n=1 Tax=Sediminibacillus albus TaxID=407036 RepID=A0A1G8YDK3_9BACI|nr:SDR family NAD(P)-dependent oxidoreductase [Sediminibacillus albus]SDK00952.1 NAD(P)-dependent dehydrogenase, short-chain alcohol dehydrogenase family [Sediminibacillus albus]
MLEGKSAIITGGASGMGRAAALRLASEGARVCLLDTNQEKLTEAKMEIEKNNGIAWSFVCDISQPKQVRQAVEEAANGWGRIDIVFANAGIVGVLAPIETMDEENWEKVMNVNLTGTFLTVKYAIPYLKKQGGSIIITSSVSGNRVFSQSGFSAYSSSKAAQAAFAKMAALELAKYNIRVNAICPGGINTDFGQSIKRAPDLEKVSIPVTFPEGDKPLEKRSGKPGQIADLVHFLASEASEHISGTEIFIDGAESLLRG